MSRRPTLAELEAQEAEQRERDRPAFDKLDSWEQCKIGFVVDAVEALAAARIEFERATDAGAIVTCTENVERQRAELRYRLAEVLHG